ncbi:hypothetical protein Patl1_26926 [Pistacia atlantica]|uniref:Uncharacterized protein n=1 Tax=Pistacia atlantica TaxID=434234 RepID=A0ACC1B2A5_9ROSI|nr:hypothetical protein Patl1_26926 [Pistacia atlantica]
MGRRKKLKKEEIAEDWCFICKDGGSLRICDYRNEGMVLSFHRVPLVTCVMNEVADAAIACRDCLKSYHPDCLGQDDSLLESKYQWTCGNNIVLHTSRNVPSNMYITVLHGLEEKYYWLGEEFLPFHPYEFEYVGIFAMNARKLRSFIACAARLLYVDTASVILGLQ